MTRTRQKVKHLDRSPRFVRGGPGGFVFEYQLWPLDPTSDVEYETSDRPPLALDGTLTLANNHVFRVEPPAADGTADIANSAYVYMSPEFLKQLREVLTRGTLTKKASRTPQELFSPDQREEMLKYHEGHDVLTPDGLAAWQRSVMERILPQAPSPIRDKGFLSMDKAARKKLQNLKADQDLNAMNIEVSMARPLGRNKGAPLTRSADL